MAGRSPFARLIYPVPERAGLGVHVTVDLGGQCRFGPDTEWIDGIDYEVDPARADVFYAEVRTLLAGLAGRRAGAGLCRHPPEAGPAGAPARDFVIDGPAVHGVPGLVELFGIESPGLTASWPIADEAARLLGLPELTDPV